MKYKIWLVYEPGIIWNVKWYVVNTETHTVQSTWNDLINARRTADQLNKWVKRGIA